MVSSCNYIGYGYSDYIPQNYDTNMTEISYFIYSD